MPTNRPVPVAGASAAGSSASVPGVILSTAQRMTAYSSQVIADGAFGYWRLGEAAGSTAVDASGHSRNGTYTPGGTGFTFSQPGAVSDGATSIKGQGDLSNVAIPTGTPDGTLAAYTLEGWVQTTTLTIPNVVIGFLATAANPVGFIRLVLLANGVFETRSNPGGVSISNFSSNGVVVINTWYHVVATWDTSNLQLYVNGVAAGAPTAGAGVITVGASGWVIGKYDATNANRSWNGLIDEIALYPSALSATQIADHYTLRTSTQTTPVYVSDPITNLDAKGVRLYGTVGNGDGTVTIKLQAQNPYTKAWVDIPGATTAALNNTTGTLLVVYPGNSGITNSTTIINQALPPIWRVAATVTNIETFSIAADYLL